MTKEHIAKYKFTKGDPRASECGKKSTHGRTWRTVIKELTALSYDTPKKIKTHFPKDKYTAKEIAIMAMMVRAWKGDVNAVKWLSETEDGKPKQPLSGDEDIPLNIKVTF